MHGRYHPEDIDTHGLSVQKSRKGVSTVLGLIIGAMVKEGFTIEGIVNSVCINLDPFNFHPVYR